MKKILLIGATSAIAKHCARIWAARGDRFFLVARNEGHLKTIATDLEIRGASGVHFYCMDLNEIGDHSLMLDRAEAALGGMDTVLIAHGTLSNQRKCEASVEETLFEIRTNGLSVVSLLTHVANRFEAKRTGTIALISSVAGERGRASNYVYGSAKAMVTTFASGLRHRLYKSDVAVVIVKPGFVDTPMTAEFKKGFLWSSPESVALGIVRAMDRKKAEVYLPRFWKAIMAAVKAMPDGLFRRLDL